MKRLFLSCFFCLAGCTHSDPFSNSTGSTAPFNGAPPAQLTFNSDQDYWPTWASDGNGILYAFVQPENPRHRCLGILPPEGGSRRWELCDNRTQRQDSASSYTAFALNDRGILIFVEAVESALRSTGSGPTITLWSADTAHPYTRTRLLTLPVTVGATPVTWLSELAWTGPSSFVALAQQYNTIPHCVTGMSGGGVSSICDGRDSVWTDGGGMVVRGTITGGQATLETVAGTEQATGYSLANNGATIAFTLKNRGVVFTVPLGGGIPFPTLSTAPVDTTYALMGVSCRGATCIYARNAVAISQSLTSGFVFAHFRFLAPNPLGGIPPFTVLTGEMDIRRLSLATGLDERVFANNTHTIYATPELSPTTGDMVLQVGGGWGHTQTFATSSVPDPSLFSTDGNSTLYLYKAFVP